LPIICVELVPALGNAGGRPTRACQRPTPFTGGVEYRRKAEECRLQAEAARVDKADLAAAQVETRARRFDLAKMAVALIARWPLPLPAARAAKQVFRQECQLFPGRHSDPVAIAEQAPAVRNR